jgi:hypothetical protein
MARGLHDFHSGIKRSSPSAGQMIERSLQFLRLPQYVL